jgi:hypothetical protein
LYKKNIIAYNMKSIKNLAIIFLFMIVPFISFGQPTKPPPPPGDPSGNENRVGAGAPLGENASALLGLIFVYGIYAFGKSYRKAKLQAAEKNV